MVSKALIRQIISQTRLMLQLSARTQRITSSACYRSCSIGACGVEESRSIFNRYSHRKSTTLAELKLIITCTEDPLVRILLICISIVTSLTQLWWKALRCSPRARSNMLMNMVLTCQIQLFFRTNLEIRTIWNRKMDKVSMIWSQEMTWTGSSAAKRTSENQVSLMTKSDKRSKMRLMDLPQWSLQSRKLTSHISDSTANRPSWTISWLSRIEGLTLAFASFIRKCAMATHLC